MAANKSNPFTFIFISLAIAPLILLQVNAVDVSNELCGRTNHKATCLSIVKADTRADLKTSPNGIATILNDKALFTARSNFITISKLLKTATDPHKVSSLKSCSSGYSEAIASLKTADFKVIGRENYGELIAPISEADDAPHDCELYFQEPPAIRSPITAQNERLRDILATILDIINLVVCNSTIFC